MIETSGRRRWLDRALYVVGAALVVWLISRFPLADVGRACLAVGPLVIVTPVLALGWQAANSAALGALLDGAVGWRTLFANRLVGEGFNALIPAAGVGGEPFKARHLSDHVPLARAVVALINDYVVENVVGLATSATFVAIGVAALDPPPAIATGLLAYAAIAALIAIAATALTLRGIPAWLTARLEPWIPNLAQQPPLAPRPLARAAAWCLVGRALGLVEIVLLFAVLDIAPTPVRVVFTAGALAAAGYVGGVIPQGLGVSEAATVGVFELMHLPGAAALAFAFARRGRMLFMTLLGVACYPAVRRRTARVSATAPRSE